jgi:tRNA 2-selenouridine synthase
MAISLSSLTDLDYDDIIDVRAPAEYAEDHIPGAINLPVLDDTERATVGTIYKQVNPFAARKLGAALVAQNAAKHLQTVLADRPGSWRPLVYCWRGGQRSGSFAMILAQIGWRVETIQGGYKAWRALVVDALYHQPFPAPIVVLDGNTGSGKTALLPHLGALGVQVLDLEGLANHRGSIFGAVGQQPSQKSFETALAYKIRDLDPLRPVVIEAESSKIGNCRLPAAIWKAMGTAPRITIKAPRAARADHLVTAYPDMLHDPEKLARIIARLRPSHPSDRVDAWLDMAQTGDFAPLAEGLMLHHYDPRYGKHRARATHSETIIQTQSLAPDNLAQIAAQIASKI